MHCANPTTVKPLLSSHTSTLGARGFSCAVSGFSQVLKRDLREKPCGFVARVNRPLTEHVSACGRRNEVPLRMREKTSGTQGSSHLLISLNFLPIFTEN